jgi:hypothetical protein
MYEKEALQKKMAARILENGIHCFRVPKHLGNCRSFV